MNRQTLWNELMIFDETLHLLLHTKKGMQIAIAVLSLSVLFCLSAFMGLCSGWYGDYQLTKTQVDQLAIQKSMDADRESVMRIPDEHLLGFTPEEDTDFLPITSLQMHLTGIMKTADEKKATAIISEAGQPGKVYRLGQELTSGITINSINDDSVVLEHNGRLEKLPLTRSNLVFQELPNSLWQDN